MSARPYSKLWHSDWIADLRFRSCTLAERGAFFGLYCLMHQGAGRLPCTLEVAAQSLAADPDELARAVKSLVRAGLLTWDGETLTDPELQRVLALSAERAKHGSEGGKVSTDGRKNGVFAQAKNASKMRGSGSGSARASKNTPGREEVLQRFTERYLETYQEPYALQGAKDNVALKAMLGKADGSLKVVFEKIDRAFEDAWLCEHGVTLTVLNQNWSRLIDREHINGHPPAQVNGGKLAARIAGILQQGKDLAAKRIEAERKAVQG